MRERLKVFIIQYIQNDLFHIYQQYSIQNKKHEWYETFIKKATPNA